MSTSNVISEFLVALGFRVDAASARRAEGTARRVERTVRDADAATTRGAVQGSAARIIASNREQGIRTRGAAHLIAEHRQRQAAEAKTIGQETRSARVRAAIGAQRAKQSGAIQKEEAEHQKAGRSTTEVVNKQHEAVQAYSRGAVLALSTLGTIATAIFGGMAKAAGKLEDTFFVSKRTGASAAGVRAFGFAAEQLGSSSKEAVASLEELSHRLKESPGFNTMLEGLGVPGKDENGRVIEFTERMMKLGDVLGGMEKHKAIAYGNALGVPSHLLDAITDPQFRKQYKEYTDMLAGAGLDPAKADQNSKSFMDIWRRMSATIGIIGLKIQGALVGAFGDRLKEFSDYLLKNAEPIAQGVVRIGEAILKLIENATDFIKKFSGDDTKSSFEGFTKGIDGLATAIGALAVVLGARLLSPLGKVLGLLTSLGALSPPAWLLAMLGVGAAAQTSAAIAKGGLPAGVDPITGRAPTEEVGTGLIAPGQEGGAQRWVQEKWESAKRAIGGTAVGKALGIGQTSATELGPTSDGSRVGRAQRDANALAIMDEFKKAGYPDIGVAALMGSAQTESSFNPKAANDVKGGHTGLFQWDSTRWPKVATWIKGQGGDPFDARWQARAMVAELDAKPGEKMYDHRKTQLGGQILRNPNDLTHAMEGVRLFERYGVGEEGNRGANARAWLPYVTGEKTMAMPKIAPPPEQAGTLPNGAPAVLKPNSMPNAPGETMAEADARRRATSDRLQKAREAAKDFNDRFNNGAAPMMDLKNSPFKNMPPLGVGPSDSADNRSFKGGDVHLKIEATGVDGKDIADASVRAWRNENAETLRNMRSAFA